jgi:hypothetical protein
MKDFHIDIRTILNNVIYNCYILIDSTARFLSALLDFVDDFVAEFRTKIVATQLIQSVAATAAKYRVVSSTRSRLAIAPKMCLVLEEADYSRRWLERIEHQRLSRRLELVRQTLFVADEIIEKTLSSPRTARRAPRYGVESQPDNPRPGGSHRFFPD